MLIVEYGYINVHPHGRMIL